MNLFTPELQAQLDAAAAACARRPEELRDDVLAGRVVIVKNRQRDIPPLAIGRGFPTRVNANIGTSADCASLADELAKLRIAERYGADAVMDLSTGGATREVRRALLAATQLPLGTVPVYEAALDAKKHFGDLRRAPAELFLKAAAEHAADGVDFMTIHAGLALSTVRRMQAHPRATGIVSRGGSLLASWMLANDAENPYLERFDELLRICRDRGVVLSLGDGLRPGSLADATDGAQIAELVQLGELKGRANQAGVQVIIEGPGHVPLSEIAMNVALEKKLCGGAPFYVLGPIPLDIAPGYDHITAAIGGAVAAAAGADFLCFVTPAEHLRLPDAEDVKQGVIAARIAAAIGDLEKGLRGAVVRNEAMGCARRQLDWDAQAKLALDPEAVGRSRAGRALSDRDACSMCGEMCALKTSATLFENP